MRCRLHGGASPKGIASPNFKHGRRSKYLPDRLVPRAVEAMADDDLVALREDLALVEVRLTQLLERIDTGEGGLVWFQLRDAYAGLKSAQAAGDVPTTMQALAEIGMLIERGCEEGAVWNEIYGVLDLRRKLADGERKRLVDLQQMITAERLAVLVGALLSVIRRNVSDSTVLAAIADDFRELVSGGNGGGAVSGGDESVSYL